MGKKIEKAKELLRSVVGSEPQKKAVAPGMSDPVLESDEPAPAKAARPDQDAQPAAGTSAAEAGLQPRSSDSSDASAEVKPVSPDSGASDQTNVGKDNS